MFCLLLVLFRGGSGGGVLLLLFTLVADLWNFHFVLLVLFRVLPSTFHFLLLLLLYLSKIIKCVVVVVVVISFSTFGGGFIFILKKKKTTTTTRFYQNQSASVCVFVPKTYWSSCLEHIFQKFFSGLGVHHFHSPKTRQSATCGVILKPFCVLPNLFEEEEKNDDDQEAFFDNIFLLIVIIGFSSGTITTIVHHECHDCNQNVLFGRGGCCWG